MCNSKITNYPGTGLPYQSSIEIDMYLFYINFCRAINVLPNKIIGRPYNREASKMKSLFVGVLFINSGKKSFSFRDKKEIARVLFMPYQIIDGLLYKVNLYLKTYPDFKGEVDEIIIKITKQ